MVSCRRTLLLNNYGFPLEEKHKATLGMAKTDEAQKKDFIHLKTNLKMV